MSAFTQYPSTTEVRDWAKTKRAGAGLSDTGPLPKVAIAGWNKTHPDRPFVAREAHHGTTGGYNNFGCRCDRCTDAKTAEVANWRAAGGASRWDA